MLLQCISSNVALASECSVSFFDAVFEPGNLSVGEGPKMRRIGKTAVLLPMLLASVSGLAASRGTQNLERCVADGVEEYKTIVPRLQGTATFRSFFVFADQR